MTIFVCGRAFAMGKEYILKPVGREGNQILAVGEGIGCRTGAAGRERIGYQQFKYLYNENITDGEITAIENKFKISS